MYLTREEKKVSFPMHDATEDSILWKSLALEKYCKLRRFLQEEVEASKTETEKEVVMFLLDITQIEIDRTARSLGIPRYGSQRVEYCKENTVSNAVAFG